MSITGGAVVGDQTLATARAARGGDPSAAEALFRPHRSELRVHCYRMLGSLDDAEDLVQETFLRAWSKLDRYEGRSSFRAWLYRIATNACLDELSRRPRRVLPDAYGPASGPDVALRPRSDISWLTPFPDRLAEPIAPDDLEPPAVIVERETLELAVIAAIQYLPPRQRAVLALRDLMGWSARETADLLDTSVPAVTSALQRARATMRARLPRRRADWSQTPAAGSEERELLRRYIAAHETADAAAIRALLHEDVRLMMPPYPMWWTGRDDVVAAVVRGLRPGTPEYAGQLRLLPTRANGQPAVANYLRRPGDDRFRALGLDVLRVEDGLIVEAVGFDAGCFAWFDLAENLPPPAS